MVKPGPNTTEIKGDNGNDMDPAKGSLGGDLSLDTNTYVRFGQKALTWHPISFSSSGMRVQFSVLSPSHAEGSFDRDPILVTKQEFNASDATFRAHDAEVLTKAHPELAAIWAGSIMTVHPQPDEPTYPDDPWGDVFDPDTLFKFNYYKAKVCGYQVVFAVSYAMLFSLEVEHIRGNLTKYMSALLEDTCSDIIPIFFEQVGSERITSSPHFKDLCKAIDDTRVMLKYLDARPDADSLERDSAIIRKAVRSFESLSPEEVKWISNEARALPREKLRGGQIVHVVSSSESFTTTQIDQIQQMASCLALLKGDAQIHEAEKLLKDNRLLGLTALGLLTSPWQDDGVRAAALKRMYQEESVVGREMAKIIFVQNDSPKAYAAAKEILDRA